MGDWRTLPQNIYLLSRTNDKLHCEGETYQFCGQQDPLNKQTDILLLYYKDNNGKFVQDSGEAASVERGVDKIKYHIKYDETTTDYDIALIKLDAPGEFFQLTRKYNTTQR